MQMASKVICLDVNYSCDASHAYQQQRHYVAPWQGESAEHFAKRLLTYLSLYEQHPSFAKEDSNGKAPDLYVQDSQQHSDKAKHQAQPANQRIFTLNQAQLDDFCRMLKGHMQLSVWREEPVLSVTDGEHMLQLDLNTLITNPH